MALIECPECGETVSSLAQACPHCGFPISLYFGASDGKPEGWPKGYEFAESLQQRIARSAYAPEALLACLAKDEDWGVRWVVAQNPNTPIEILWRLAEDVDSDVRAAVAANACTPIELLEFLSDDGSDEVREAILSNPGTPEYIVSEFMKGIGEEDDEQDAMDDEESCDSGWDDYGSEYDSGRHGGPGAYYDDYGRKADIVIDYGDGTVLNEDGDELTWRDDYSGFW